MNDQSMETMLNNNLATQEGITQPGNDVNGSAMDLLQKINEQCVSHQDLSHFGTELYQRILNEMNSLFTNYLSQINSAQQVPNEQFKVPEVSAEDQKSVSSVKYDLDNDVIMRTRYPDSVKQIPEPGCFRGITSETELFCDLCEDTFKTYPNSSWPEESKINFVRSRLRDAARNWYLTKYKGNKSPKTMKELLDGLRIAFNDVGSNKLAKIKLTRLKQSYGDINKYIESFRNYTNKFNLDEESSALLFYNGLHPKYQKEIEKLDQFPTNLETITTKCILFETSLIIKDKIKQDSDNNNNHRQSKSHSNKHTNDNSSKSYIKYNKNNNNYNKNKDYDNKNNNNYNNNRNQKKNYNNNDNYVNKTQKSNSNN